MLHHVTAVRESIYTKLSGLTWNPAAACADSLSSQLPLDPFPHLGHMAEYPKPGSYGDIPNPYSESEPDVLSGDGSGMLSWDDNTLDPCNFGPNAYGMDDWTGDRFDWTTGTVFKSGFGDTQSSTEHTVDPSSRQATLNNPLSISTNCVDPATSTASVSPSNVCDQSEQATKTDYESDASNREGAGILPWIRMDRYSQNRLEKSYSGTPESVNRDVVDSKLRREIWQSLQGKSTEAVKLNGQRVFFKVCHAGMARGKCEAILVVLSMDAKVDWSKYACYKCENRKASRRVRSNKPKNKADTIDPGGRKVPGGQASQKAAGERTRGGNVMTWDFGYTSRSKAISDVIKAQKLLAAE